jgi:hypothetical protein
LEEKYGKSKLWEEKALPVSKSIVPIGFATRRVQARQG